MSIPEYSPREVALLAAISSTLICLGPDYPTPAQREHYQDKVIVAVFTDFKGAKRPKVFTDNFDIWTRFFGASNLIGFFVIDPLEEESETT